MFQFDRVCWRVSQSATHPSARSIRRLRQAGPAVFSLYGRPPAHLQVPANKRRVLSDPLGFDKHRSILRSDPYYIGVRFHWLEKKSQDEIYGLIDKSCL